MVCMPCGIGLTVSAHGLLVWCGQPPVRDPRRPRHDARRATVSTACADTIASACRRPRRAAPSRRAQSLHGNWFSPELVALIQEASSPRLHRAAADRRGFPIAWASAAAPRAEPRKGSIIFGRDIFDGVLFPALWLGLVWVARQFCARPAPAAGRVQGGDSFPAIAARDPADGARDARGLPEVAASCARSRRPCRGWPGAAWCCGSPACCRRSSTRSTTCTGRWARAR